MAVVQRAAMGVDAAGVGGEKLAAAVGIERHYNNPQSAVFRDYYAAQDKKKWLDEIGPKVARSGLSLNLLNIKDTINELNETGDIKAAQKKLYGIGGENLLAAGTIGVSKCKLPRESGVWDLAPVVRGKAIHQRLGQNLPDNFPVIDRFDNGIVTSIKSMDVKLKSFADGPGITKQSVKYIDKLAGFQGRNWANVQIGTPYGGPAITAKGLDLAVPSGATAAQQKALNSLVTYGAQRGVTVRIVVVR